MCRSAKCCNVPGWTTAKCLSGRVSRCVRRCRTLCELGRNWTQQLCGDWLNRGKVAAGLAIILLSLWLGALFYGVL